MSHLVDVADGDAGEEDLVQGPGGGLDGSDHLGLVEVHGGDVDKVAGSNDGATNNHPPDVAPGVLTGKYVPGNVRILRSLTGDMTTSDLQPWREVCSENSSKDLTE